jgi:hypothetical protein
LKRLLNSFVFCFFTSLSFAQIDTGFIQHLTLNNLKNEHQTYLNSLSVTSDSVNYFRAKFNLKYGNDSLFIRSYEKSKEICQADTLLIKTAGAHLLTQGRKAENKIWFGSLEQNKVRSDLSLIYQASEQPDLYTKEIFPEELQKPFSRYKKSCKKKPFAAALLSTVLPGSGKLYAGKTKTFFLTFLLSAAYAAQTYESSQKLGLKHPLSIVNASAFAVFYLSNIYGSYHSVLELRKERKKQFLADAARFYN